MKVFFDYAVAIFICPVVLPILVILSVLTIICNGGNGIFIQQRIGKNEKPFIIYKLRTYHKKTHKINTISKFLRKYKLDELPQIINIFEGQMSFVGPRPDVKAYADKLKGEERKILSLKPGITGPASLKYYNEEEILKTKEKPLEYYDNVIFPDKIKINLDYYYNNNIFSDIKILVLTLRKIFN